MGVSPSMVEGKQPHRRTARLVVPITVLLALGVAGCGGSSQPDAVATTSGAGVPTPSTTTSTLPSHTIPPPPVTTQRQVSLEEKATPTETETTTQSDDSDSSSSTPMELEVPALSINAPVIPIAMYDGVLTPPSNTSTVGWWSQGARPGSSSGTAVLVGHAVHTGGGVFNSLDTLGPGSSITVETSSGDLSYTVSRVEVYHKSELPAHAQEVFGQSGPGRLVLVSCDDWDGSVWESNVVVFAEPS